METEMEVLICEDNIITAERIQTYLLNKGYKVLDIVKSCEALYEQLQSKKELMTIVDIHLEDGDVDFKVLSALLKNNSHKVIFISGEKNFEIIKQTILCDPIGFLSKPIVKENLLFYLTKSKLESENNTKADPIVELSKYLFNDNLCSNDFSARLQEFLKSTRQKFNLTQDDYARFLGISTRQLQRIESGRSNISLQTLTIILKGSQELSELRGKKIS